MHKGDDNALAIYAQKLRLDKELEEAVKTLEKASVNLARVQNNIKKLDEQGSSSSSSS